MSEKKEYDAPVFDIPYFGVKKIMTISGGGVSIELLDHER